MEDPENERDLCDVRERFRPRPEPDVLSAAFEGLEPLLGLGTLSLRSLRGRGFDSPLVLVRRLASTGIRLAKLGTWEPVLCADALPLLLAGRDTSESEAAPGSEGGWEAQSSDRESSQASSILSFFVPLDGCGGLSSRALRHGRLCVVSARR